MTIARQFKVLAGSASLLIVAFAATLAYQFYDLSGQGARLIENLQRTTELAQQLASGNTEQTIRLQQQFEKLDPAFAEGARALNYTLGDRYTAYLKLDIDEQERLTVERIKELQSESSLIAMQIYELLRSGRTADADLRVHRLYQLHGDIRSEFDTLHGLQLGKIKMVVDHLNRSAERALLAVYALVVALAVFTAVSIFMLRTRILKPVRAILDASERMREGDLTARAPLHRNDELGQLTRGFNFMAESLAGSHADLERKVDERARQLQEMQGQLIRADKMSAVGLLVSGVAHELNNPLAAIRGFAEMARMELQSGASGSGRGLALLEELDSQVERCRKIVVNLLQFARQHEPRREAIDINAVVEQVLQLREYELNSRNITLVREFDPANAVLLGDRDRIQQVVLNLLNNAHDAIRETDRSGTIRVRTRADADTVTIEFEDDGPGFADPQRAFDPFYTTKEVGKGTGLGLSVCYGIITEHGGEIRTRNLDKGAVITVTLPAGDAASADGADGRHRAAPADAAPQLPSAVALRALVVDDEEMLLRLQVSFLGKMGIKGVGVASGDEAIRYLQANDVDVVISDVRMPGDVDGVQLFEWVKDNKPELAARFLFASGDLVGLNLGEFFQRTAAPRVEKPFRYADYARVIRQVLRGGAQPQ